MKKRTLETIICVLIILLISSLHFKLKQEITIDCKDLGMSTIFVDINTIDILKAMEERYQLKSKPAGVLFITNLNLDANYLKGLEHCNYTLCGKTICLKC